MDTNNQNNISGTTHTLTASENIETINFINTDTQQDTLDVSNVISSEANAENMNLYLKINTDGVYVDNSGSGKFSVDNQVARFNNTTTMNAMVAVQVSESLATTVDWTETSHIAVENIDDGTKNTVLGTDADDNLQGTSANDSLRGSWGNDTLAGSGGADTYIGGAGNDVYVLSNDGEIDKIDFIATDSEKDSLDVSNILPEGATAANISQYIKVTEAGVFLDNTGQGSFTTDNLIAEFTDSSVFNVDNINLVLGTGENILLSLSSSAGVQLDEGESYASAEELAGKLETIHTADSSGATTGTAFVRSYEGDKLNLNLQDHNINEAHGGAGNERLDASSVSTNIGDGNLSAAESVKLYGKEGSDTLVGSSDSNFLDGGAGNDRIEAGLGRNLLAGGEGEDEFVLTLEDNSAEVKSDNLYDFSSQEGHRDIINLEQVLPSSANTTNIHSYVKVTDTGVFIDVTGKAHFSNDNQLARFGEKASIDNLINIRLADGHLLQMNRDNALKTIQGEDTADEIQGGAGSDVLYGNAGDDTLDGDSLANTSSADHLYGGEGQDTLRVDNLDLTSGTVDGGTGFDTVHIAAEGGTSTSIDMQASNVEKVFGAESSDVIDGSGYTDTSGGYNKSTGEYETTESQRLELYGKGGDDTLTGGVGRDYIDGGSGDDIISGGAGRDFLYGASGNDTFVLADDNEQYDNLYDFKSNSDQHDILDISAFVTEDVDTSNLQNYFSIAGNYIYFDKSGSGDFTTNNIIAKLGEKADLTESVTLKFGDDTASFNADTGEFDRSGIFANNAPDAGTVNLTGAEDSNIIFTKQQLLADSTDVEGDTLSVTDVSYTGDNGNLTGIPAIYFDENTNNNIILEPTLQSFNEFSVELTYISTGEHSGSLDPLLSIATPVSGMDNSLLIQVNNADGSLGVFVAGSNYAVFEGINMHDGQVHNIQLTWDSESGSLKLFDNHSLIGTETVAQGLQIGTDGKVVLGQEQDTYGGGFDTEQALTNGALTQVTMAYEAVDDATITAGASLADSSANLAFNIVPDNNNIVETVSNANLEITSGVTIDTGYYAFTPDANFNGNVNIDYAINDGFDTTTAQADLTVTAVNDAPTAINLSANTIAENSTGAIVGDLTTDDVDAGETHTYTVSDNRFEVVANQLKLKDGISLDHETATSVDVTVTTTDTAGAMHSQLFNVLVQNVNEAPEVDQGFVDQTIAEEATLSYTIPDNAFSDIEGDNLTFTATLADGSALPAWLSFDAATKTFSGTPDDAEIGIINIKVTVSDGEFTADASFPLEVTAVNDFPTAINLSANTIAENSTGAIVGDLTTDDVDAGETHTYTVSDNRFEVVANQLKLKDGISLDHETATSIDVTVTTTDTAGAMHSQLFNVVVQDVNEAPEVDQGFVDQTIAEEATLSYTVPDNAFSDIEGDNLTFTATLADGSALPAWLSFDAATKTFSGTPDDAEIGIINIKVTVSDGEFTADASFPLEVTAVNDFPTAINLSANTIAENSTGAIVGDLTTDDVDAGETHTYTVSDNRFEVVANQLKLKDGISLDHETATSVDVTVTTTDTAGAMHSQLFNVVVSDVNDAPTVTETAVIHGAEDTTLIITNEQLLVNASDVDGDDLSVVNASYSGSDGTLTTINAMRFGTDTDNKIELTDKLQSIDTFSLNINYKSTGSHSGGIDSIFSVSTPSQQNALTVIAQSNGDLLVYINDESIIFTGVDMHDGASHNIVLTWDSSTGSLALYDNSQLIETQTTAQGQTIAADGWVILGQEQDSYGGGFDATQVLTNAELGQVTLAYDVVSQADIEAGTSVADASNNLALDLVVEDGQIVDRANDSAITTAGSIDAGYHQFTPNANFNGNLTIDYEVSDGTNTTATQATLDITAVNDAPELLGTPLVESVVVAYSFDSNVATDNSGNSNSVTLNGSATYGVDHTGTGTAFTMDGTDGSGKIDGVTTGGAMSVSTWVKYDNFEQHWSRVFDFGDGQGDNVILLAHNGTGNTLAFEVINNAGTGETAKLHVADFFTVGEWVHVTATIDDTGLMSIYKNGELAGSIQGVVPEETVRNNNYIGDSNWVNDGHLEGSIDNFIIYDRAVTAEEAKNIYSLDTVNELLQNNLFIAENTADNSVVGSVVANDIENNDLEYSLTNDAGGRFAIDSTTGEIIVADGSLLDFEAMDSHTITVQASDGNLTSSKDYTIKLNNVDIEGTAADDNLVGTIDSDFIQGMAANDTLDGGAGDDVLSGGAGNDILTGGDGSDHFIWHAEDIGTVEAPAEDVITDFHTGENGDVIDLSEILTEDANPLESYLNLNFENGNTTIEVSQESGGSPTQKITLEGVDLSGYGGATSNAEIINNLLDDGNLDVYQ